MNPSDATIGNLKTLIMKRLFLLLLLTSALISCEDVIDVDLTNEDPRLIVDALVRIDTTQNLTEAIIKVSLSTSFFGEIEPAILESMQIQKESGGSFVPFEPVPGEPGNYRPFTAFGSPVADNKIVTSFLTDPEETYLLFVQFEDQLYFARSTFATSVPINSVSQGDGQLFDEDDTEIVISITDVPDREDFYIFDFDFNEFLPTEDRFYEGQEFEFSYFYDADIEPGDELDISVLGADRSFFDYMNGLLEQSEQGANGPFQTPVATIRGNLLNVTGIDNIDQFDNVNRPDAFILGYFSLSQEFKTSLVIE